MSIIPFRDQSVNQSPIRVAFAEAVARRALRPLPPLDGATQAILDDLHRIVPHLVYRKGFHPAIKWAIASYGVDHFARSAGARCVPMVDLWATKIEHPEAGPWHQCVPWTEIVLPWPQALEWGVRGEWPTLEVIR